MSANAHSHFFDSRAAAQISIVALNYWIYALPRSLF